MIRCKFHVTIHGSQYWNVPVKMAVPTCHVFRLLIAKPLLKGGKNVRKTISSTFETAVRNEQREIEVSDDNRGLREAGNNFSFFHTMKHILLIYNWGNYIKTKFG